MEAHMYVGLDLGGAISGNSIVSVLRDTTRKPHLVRMDPLGHVDDAGHTDPLSSFEPSDTVLAIDAPLTTPICLAQSDHCESGIDCRVEVCARLWRYNVSRRRGGRTGLPFLERTCELELRSGRWQTYGITPKSTMRLGQIMAYGIHLKRRLVKAGFRAERIIEVYPGASWKIVEGSTVGKILTDARRDRPKALRYLGESLRKWIEADLESLMKYDLDGLDSAMCALTAYWHAHGETERVGDEDGWIVVPRAPRLSGASPSRRLDNRESRAS